MRQSLESWRPPVFTPLNTRTLTVSRDFAKLPHRYHVQYFDAANDWQTVSPEPIVYMDGFNAATQSASRRWSCPASPIAPRRKPERNSISGSYSSVTPAMVSR